MKAAEKTRKSQIKPKLKNSKAQFPILNKPDQTSIIYNNTSYVELRDRQILNLQLFHGQAQ